MSFANHISERSSQTHPVWRSKDRCPLPCLASTGYILSETHIPRWFKKGKNYIFVDVLSLVKQKGDLTTHFMQHNLNLNPS